MVKRVLSIQSHVTHGYVGNKIAVPCLQSCGYEVDFINSVNFSNHCGYNSFKGIKTTKKDADLIFSGLYDNNLLKYDIILTGYCGSFDFIESVSEHIISMKNMNNNLLYVCDPVLGDSGKFYVSKEIVQIYTNTLLKYADIITPNQFEIEVISGVTITSECDVIEAIKRTFFNYDIQYLVITSALINKDEFYCYFSLKTKEQLNIYKLPLKMFDMNFSGTGDLFSAVLTSLIGKIGKDCVANQFKAIIEISMDIIHKVLLKTIEHIPKMTTIDHSKSLDVSFLELKIVECMNMLFKLRNLIENESYFELSDDSIFKNNSILVQQIVL